MTSSSADTARRFDHCVLPVSSLNVARDRLTQLGFTVAPDAAHPFGTSNCCVFLSDGTYLEPLSVVDDALAREAVGAGNVFVARNQRYRSTVAVNGFSAAVLASDDAPADHARFVDAAISAGDSLFFSRRFKTPQGTEAEASFHLAFAAPGAEDPTFFFTCQRVKVPDVDRSALLNHENGALGIREVVLGAQNPGDHKRFLTAFAGTLAEMRDDALELPLDGTRLSVLGWDIIEQRYGHATEANGSDLILLGIIFSVGDLARTRRYLETAGVSFAEKADSLVLPTTEGQGALFIFKEDQA